MFMFKSHDELAALPEYARLRYVANRMWVAIALGVLFGLQIAFLEGFRTMGLIIVALVVLCIPCPAVLALRARRLRAGDHSP
jgi:hypothetical protein